jgi:hypothetical protein
MGPRNIFEPPSENHLIERPDFYPRHGYLRPIVGSIRRSLPANASHAGGWSSGTASHQAGWSRVTKPPACHCGAASTPPERWKVGRHSPTRMPVSSLALRPRTMATRHRHYVYVD